MRKRHNTDTTKQLLPVVLILQMLWKRLLETTYSYRTKMIYGFH